MTPIRTSSALPPAATQAWLFPSPADGRGVPVTNSSVASRVAREEAVPGTPLPPTVEGKSHACVAAGGRADDDPKLREATRQWEAFFVGYLLKQMRKTTGESDNKDNPFAPSDGEKTFRDMLDDETAQSLSKTRGLGLADLLYDQMRPAAAPNGVANDK